MSVSRLKLSRSTRRHDQHLEVNDLQSMLATICPDQILASSSRTERSADCTLVADIMKSNLPNSLMPIGAVQGRVRN